jgi:hypothetical protein
VGDANTLSCARDMKGVIAAGDAVTGGSDLKTRARASGVSGGGGAWPARGVLPGRTF